MAQSVVKYGRLTIVGVFSDGKHKQANCVCDCGKTKTIRLSRIKAGGTKSCGCLGKELFIARATTHGATKDRKISSEYKAWATMLDRCYRTSHPSYGNYGGRGIAVCDEWRHDFVKFLEDMGAKPSPKHSLDRIDNSKGYCKENCTWSTNLHQTRNRRSSLFVIYKGEQVYLKDLCNSKNVSYTKAWKRIRSQGWSVEDAIDNP